MAGDCHLFTLAFADGNIMMVVGAYEWFWDENAEFKYCLKFWSSRSWSYFLFLAEKWGILFILYDNHFGEVISINSSFYGCITIFPSKCDGIIPGVCITMNELNPTIAVSSSFTTNCHIPSLVSSPSFGIYEWKCFYSASNLLAGIRYSYLVCRHARLGIGNGNRVPFGVRGHGCLLGSMLSYACLHFRTWCYHMYISILFLGQLIVELSETGFWNKFDSHDN